MNKKRISVLNDCIFYCQNRIGYFESITIVKKELAQNSDFEDRQIKELKSVIDQCEKKIALIKAAQPKISIFQRIFKWKQ